VYRLIRNQDDADECFQETFLAALEVSTRQPVQNWPALLKRLATRRAIDRLRRKLRHGRREAPADLTLAEGPGADPSEQAQAAELASALQRAVAELPERQAEVFWLHELGNWSHQQIADQLGITPNAVGVILHRARQKLQELLSIQNQISSALKQERSD
jgi:RNA polymerase sigma-70 factor (ECF subfamily)